MAIDLLLERYAQQGYQLTVRQVFYQLVTQNLISNSERSYDLVGRVIADGRLAGLLDWDMIEDRVRQFSMQTRWASVADLLKAAAATYHEDRWTNQAIRLVCFVEKDALSGILEPVCREFDVPLLAARGYASLTVLYEFASKTIRPAVECGQVVRILYLGDHDPSGLDMVRDIEERLLRFLPTDYPVDQIGLLEIVHVGLKINQVQALRLPPNPTKLSDSRSKNYITQYGQSSWELDAVPPERLSGWVREQIVESLDTGAWRKSGLAIKRGKKRLRALAKEDAQP